MHFIGTAGSGLTVHVDSNPVVGGQGEGLRPTELVAIGLAGCTAMDVISILRKKREKVSGLEVSVDIDRAETHPKIFTDINVHYVATGHDISPAALERAIELSETKYCTVSAMLQKSSNITTSFEIVEE